MLVDARTNEPILYTTDQYQVSNWEALEAILDAQNHLPEKFICRHRPSANISNWSPPWVPPSTTNAYACMKLSSYLGAVFAGALYGSANDAGEAEGNPRAVEKSPRIWSGLVIAIAWKKKE